MAIELSLVGSLISTLLFGGIYIYLAYIKKSPILANILATIIMIFAFINVEGAKDMALIYVLLGLVAVAMSIVMNTTHKGDKEPKTTTILTDVVIGITILGLMLLIQAGTSGLVVGVPLAIGFGLFGVGAAAFIENAVFVRLLSLFDNQISDFFKSFFENLTRKIPFLAFLMPILTPVIIVVLPLIMISIFFGAFHANSYAGRVASMIFATSIMMIWLIVYKKTGSQLSLDIAHFGWNVTIKITHSVGLVIGGN